MFVTRLTPDQQLRGVLPPACPAGLTKTGKKNQIHNIYYMQMCNDFSVATHSAFPKTFTPSHSSSHRENRKENFGTLC